MLYVKPEIHESQMHRNNVQCLSFKVSTVVFLVKDVKLNMWNFLKGKKTELKLNVSFVFSNYEIMHAFYKKQ